MAYVSKEKMKQVREDLKKEFPTKQGWKFSIKKRDYAVVDVAIMKSPFDFETEYMQLNQYCLEEDFSGEKRKELEKVLDIINEGNFDKSDVMTDYFHVGFYINLSIGRWDKPYIQTVN